MPNYSTSANNNDSNAWKAFDNKADTNWTASYTTTGELVFNFGVPTTIKGVRFTPVSGKLTSFPKKAYLSGSSGSGSPTELQIFNLTEPTDDTPQSFKFDNTPVKYATYIFTFGDTFAASSGTKEVAIAEIEFLVSKGIVIPEPKLQEKTVTPTTSTQNVTPDNGYDGLSKVTVEAVSLTEGSVSPGSSATVLIPPTGILGYSKVSVNAAPLQEKTVTPTTSQQIIMPDSGNYGLSKVTVNAAAAAASPSLQTKTVTPTTSTQNVTPDSGYDGLSKVTVNGVSLQSKSITPTTSSQTVTPASSYLGLSQVSVGAIPSTYVNTSDATATASDILPGKTAYVNGSKITGSFRRVEFAHLTIHANVAVKITIPQLTSERADDNMWNYPYSLKAGASGTYLVPKDAICAFNDTPSSTNHRITLNSTSSKWGVSCKFYPLTSDSSSTSTLSKAGDVSNDNVLHFHPYSSAGNTITEAYIDITIG